MFDNTNPLINIFLNKHYNFPRFSQDLIVKGHIITTRRALGKCVILIRTVLTGAPCSEHSLEIIDSRPEHQTYLQDLNVISCTETNNLLALVQHKFHPRHCRTVLPQHGPDMRRRHVCCWFSSSSPPGGPGGGPGGGGGSSRDDRARQPALETCLHPSPLPLTQLHTQLHTQATVGIEHSQT